MNHSDKYWENRSTPKITRCIICGDPASAQSDPDYPFCYKGCIVLELKEEKIRTDVERDLLAENQ